MKKKNIFFIAFALFMIILAVQSFIEIRQTDAKVRDVQISKMITNIDQQTAKINAEKDDAKKLEGLKALIKKAQSYNTSEQKEAQVASAYQKHISKLKKYFEDKNDAVVTEAKNTDLEKETKENISKNIEMLKATLQTAETQKGVVYSNSSLKRTQKQINKLLQAHTDRLTQIAEEEEKAQAAADEAAYLAYLEALQAEQAQRQAQAEATTDSSQTTSSSETASGTTASSGTENQGSTNNPGNNNTNNGATGNYTVPNNNADNASANPSSGGTVYDQNYSSGNGANN
ncbi:hypothetical protein QUW13_09055 [Enterococcus hirae]|nr:hypothetical protein [Enterococcus hirae]